MDSLHGNARRIRRFLNRCAQDEHTDTGEATELLERVMADLLSLAGEGGRFEGDQVIEIGCPCHGEALCYACMGAGFFRVTASAVDRSLDLVCLLAERGCEDDARPPNCDCPGCTAEEIRTEMAGALGQDKPKRSL